MSNYEELIRPEFEVQCKKLGRGIERGTHFGEYASLPTYDAWEELKLAATPLLAALEEKDQRIKELSSALTIEKGASAFEGRRTAHIDGMRDKFLKRAEAAEQREGNLKSDVDVLSARNAELQQRLQQPIKLPRTYEITGEFSAVVMKAEKVRQAIRNAGFKVKGE